MAEPTTPRAAAAAAASSGADTSNDQPTPLRKTTTSSSNSTPRSPGERRNSLGQLVRTASMRLIEANPPGGMWSATGQLASKAPTMSELRGSSYSSNRPRRPSQPLESPRVADEERSQSRISNSDFGETPFMTPLQTPLAIVNSDFMSEPDPMDAVDSGQKTPQRTTPEKTPRRRSLKDSDGSDDTIQESMAGDEDLAPALAVISQGDFQEQPDPASNRNSVVEKRASLKASEPSKRTSFLARLIRGKDSAATDEKAKENALPDGTGKGAMGADDTDKEVILADKGKENIAPASHVDNDIDDLLDPKPKRKSKRLDKFFGEDPSNPTSSAALAAVDINNEPKRHSKNLDKFLGEDTSKVAPDTTVAKAEQRHTRDFADMVEGDDADFPELLFGRNDMPTQSYDESQRKPREPKPKSTTEDADLDTTKSFTKTSEPTAAALALKADKTTLPPKDNLTGSARKDRGAAATSDEDGGSQEGEVEEDIDWDGFMRGIDERPPQRSKHASKDMSKFFGEDPAVVGREASPAPDAAPTPPHEASAVSEEKRKRFSRPLSALSGDRLSSKTGTPRNVSPSPGPGPTNLRAETQPQPAKELQEARATAEPAEELAATEAKAEKALAVGADSEEDQVYPTGYRYPPKKTAWQGFLAGLKAFLKFTFTPLGFFVVIYGLLVVAWGGMLFLLICNAAPAMCQLGNGGFDCNDINAPRRVWVEIDSQILNALFCVTGFGLIPWRFRDWYFLMRFRVAHDPKALRRLSGWHAGWFRLPGSDTQPVPAVLPHGRMDPEAVETNAAYPLPAASAPLLPLTGSRAPATPLWRLDFVVWAFVLNTLVQACLSGAMWGLNRYNRPSWVTGFLVALAMLIAMAGGIMQFVEGRRIKRIEGVAWDDDAAMTQAMDEELGLGHTGSSPDSRPPATTAIDAESEKGGLAVNGKPKGLGKKAT